MSGEHGLGRCRCEAPPHNLLVHCGTPCVPNCQRYAWAVLHGFIEEE